MECTKNDIATASEIAQFTDGRRPGDPLHTSETLYRQRSQWLLLRRQGSINSVVPLTPKESQAWLEQRCFIGQLAQWFGERVRKPRAVA